MNNQTSCCQGEKSDNFCQERNNEECCKGENGMACCQQINPQTGACCQSDSNCKQENGGLNDCEDCDDCDCGGRLEDEEVCN